MLRLRKLWAVRPGAVAIQQGVMAQPKARQQSRKPSAQQS
ncbi:hypothetical protein COO91_07840 [Nostoc flagelliforme CCNUN1]|uniref:Uncharacterized protein n=1 Tax=Nostoc flagelliforme CCNUN1 TaxID=2038116 RepID=A0A2K8T262_9NOSO|nr:hypothetical protein COO91_07840 [Nostoc flagelliforme CCNUN1]